MQITIYGSGCPRCHAAKTVVQKVLDKMGISAEIIEIKDLNAMAEAGVMFTPAIAIDGAMVIEGRIPEPSEVSSAIEERV